MATYDRIADPMYRWGGELVGRPSWGLRRVAFVEAGLGRPLPVEGAVDAVLSTATFHRRRRGPLPIAHPDAVGQDPRTGSTVGPRGTLPV